VAAAASAGLGDREPSPLAVMFTAAVTAAARRLVVTRERGTGRGPAPSAASRAAQKGWSVLAGTVTAGTPSTRAGGGGAGSGVVDDGRLRKQPVVRHIADVKNAVIAARLAVGPGR
jgi:hypothetical protein